ncbi:MAG: hypothetical protein JNM18_09215 [Planctomycetaceae bacterium]|nr:hypothetical protein [Planctomycetaceae bacterium]
MKRWVIFALLSVVLLVSAASAIWKVHLALDAESTHQAYLQTIEAIALYLAHHDRRWPPDLEALASFALKHDAESFRSLDNLTDLQRRVEIRFDVTPEEVVGMDSQTFDAVRPREPHFGEISRSIERLLQAAKGCREPQRGARR